MANQKGVRPEGLRYTGKKLDADAFLKAYNRYATRQISLTKCAEEIGISYPTLRKHVETLLTTGELVGIFTDPSRCIRLDFGNTMGGA